MMKYDFDRVIDRSVTNDMKWHTGPVRSYLNVEVREDMIPMWIADMDFACPPCVVEAVKARAEKEIYGYCAPGADYFKAVTYWYKSRYGIALDPACICVVPSVVLINHGGSERYLYFLSRVVETVVGIVAAVTVNHLLPDFRKQDGQ